MRIPQRADTAVVGNSQTPAAPVAQPRTTRPPAAASIDIDAITAQITERVLATVTEQLTPLITKIVTDVVSEVLPKFVQKIITALRPPSVGLASPFDIAAIARNAAELTQPPQGDAAHSSTERNHE